nr:unnamed protein product [Digitaria exilis]
MVYCFMQVTSSKLQDNVSHDSDTYYILSMISLVALVAFVIAFSFGMGAIPWLMMSEVQYLVT